MEAGIWNLLSELAIPKTGIATLVFGIAIPVFGIAIPLYGIAIPDTEYAYFISGIVYSYFEIILLE